MAWGKSTKRAGKVRKLSSIDFHFFDKMELPKRDPIQWMDYKKNFSNWP